MKEDNGYRGIYRIGHRSATPSNFASCNVLPLEVVVHVEDDDDDDSRWDEVVEVRLSNLAFGHLAELL